MTEVSRRCQERPGECGGDGQRRLAAGVDVPDWGWYMGTPPHTTWTILQHDGPNHLGLCCNAALCASNGPDHLGSCCPSGFAVVGTVLSVRSPPPALQTTPSSVRRRSGTRWGTCIRAPHSGNRTTPNQRDDAALCSPSTDTTPSLWSGHHTTKETMQRCVLTVHPHETITISLVPWPPRPHTPATRPCSAGSTRGSRWPAGDVVVTAPHSSRSLWRIPTAAVGLTRHVVRALVCCGGKYAI